MSTFSCITPVKNPSSISKELEERTHLRLSRAEIHFLKGEVLNGEFKTLSAAQRHYFRKGLESEGLLEAALAI